MDVRLSPEQRALRDSAAQVVDRLGPKAVGQLDDAERIAKLDAAVAAAGWRELRAAAEDGAPWASGVEVGIVAEELGRGLADTAFLGPTLAAELRRLAAAPPAPSPETVALLPDLSAPAVAVTPSASAAVAVDAFGGVSAALVSVPADGGYRLGRVAVPEGRTGVDLTRPTVALDGRLPARDVVGNGSPRAAGGEISGEERAAADSQQAVVLVPEQGRVIGDDDLAQWTALGLAVSSADLVGLMRGAVHLAVEYAKERRQFKRPIGSFQAVQHLLADAHVATEGARSAALHAAWAVDALPPADALAAAAAAKAYCARAARSVCETAIQVHGGIGNTWECLAHVFLRRALVSGDVLGGVGPCLDRVLAHRGIDRGTGRGGRRGLR